MSVVDLTVEPEKEITYEDLCALRVIHYLLSVNGNGAMSILASANRLVLFRLTSQQRFHHITAAIALMGNSIQPKRLKIAVTLAGNSASIQKMFKRVAVCASGAIGLQRSGCTTVSGCAGKDAVDCNLCHHQLPACLLTSALKDATAMQAVQEV